MKFTSEDIGKEVYGRITFYHRLKGYGYIMSETGADIFLSSYELGCEEQRAFIGAYVKFIVGERNGRMVAKNIKVLKKFGKDISSFRFPSGLLIPVRQICKVGRANGYDRVFQNGITYDMLQEHGYTVRDLDYLYVDTCCGTYSFFRENGPVTGDGQIDIESCYAELKELLCGIHKEDFDQIRDGEASGIYPMKGRYPTKTYVLGMTGSVSS